MTGGATTLGPAQLREVQISGYFSSWETFNPDLQKIFKQDLPALHAISSLAAVEVDVIAVLVTAKRHLETAFVVWPSKCQFIGQDFEQAFVQVVDLLAPIGAQPEQWRPTRR